MLSLHDERAVTALIEHGTQIRKASGVILFEEGAAASGIYLVLSGAVRLSVSGPSSLRIERTATAGSLLGVPATITGAPYSVSAAVVQDADLIHVSRAQLVSLMQTNVQMALAIVDLLSTEVHAMRALIGSIAPDSKAVH